MSLSFDCQCTENSRGLRVERVMRTARLSLLSSSWRFTVFLYRELLLPWINALQSMFQESQSDIWSCHCARWDPWEAVRKNKKALCVRFSSLSSAAFTDNMRLSWCFAGWLSVTPPIQFDGVVQPGFSPCPVNLEQTMVIGRWKVQRTYCFSLLALLLCLVIGRCLMSLGVTFRFLPCFCFECVCHLRISKIPAHCIFSNFACLVFSLPIVIAKC